MCISKKILMLIIASLYVVTTKADDNEKLSLSGFVSGMQNFTITDVSKEWLNDYNLHNRFDILWTPNKNLTIEAGLRTRILTGNTISANPGMEDMIDADQGIIDMSFNISTGKSYIINSTIDRLYANYVIDKFEISLGRQRINWGISTAWNPNDIFNAYSFFDFDYIKRPGSDAVRFKYYPGNTSVIEFATAVDDKDNITSALYSRFAMLTADIQLSAGVYKSEDAFIGAGWSSYISGIGFKGEVSTFIPYKNKTDRDQVWIATVGTDYMFENSLSLTGEVMYQSNVAELKLGNGFLTARDIDVRSMSFSKISLFGSASYPATPLLNTSLSVMYFPDIKGFFINPSVEYSITDNWYLSAIAQYFSGEIEERRTGVTMIFLRLKLNF
jgi:hypothetical protein